jgi:hypothetical protein
MLTIYQNTTSLISIILPSAHNYYLFVFIKDGITHKSIYQTIPCDDFCFNLIENIELGIWDINIFGQASPTNLDPALATFLYDNDVEVKVSYSDFLVTQTCDFIMTENGDFIVTEW